MPATGSVDSPAIIRPGKVWSIHEWSQQVRDSRSQKQGWFYLQLGSVQECSPGPQLQWGFWPMGGG